MNLAQYKKNLQRATRNLSLSSESEGVASFPWGVGWTTDGLGEVVSLANSSGSLSLRGKTTHFPMFGDTLGDPLHLWVVSDGVVVWIDKNNLKVLVGRIFAYPVGVENSEGTTVAADTLFGNGLQTAGELDKDTLVDGFTHGCTLWHWLLTSSTSHTDSACG